MKTQLNNNLKIANQFVFLLISSFILFAGCEKAEMVQSPTVKNSENNLKSAAQLPFIMLAIEHNCMGTSLPDYNVYLASDGQVTFKGWSNVANIGTYKFYTDKANVSYIKNMFEAANYFNISPIPSQYGDPFIATTYGNRYATNIIIDYDQGMPQLLIQIRKKAEEKLGIEKYVSGIAHASSVSAL